MDGGELLVSGQIQYVSAPEGVDGIYNQPPDLFCDVQVGDDDRDEMSRSCCRVFLRAAD